MSEKETPPSSPLADSLQAKPPAVGEAAPGFELPDSLGQLRRLDALVAERPLVLLFYRGHW